MGREARERAAINAAEGRSTERYFFHSFPRRADSSKAGLAVLRSMVEAGFLLVPEIIKWQEPLMDGRLSEPFFVAQKRICFTELTEPELPEHSNRFGPFSLEFTVAALRQLGAVPVFYVPRGATDEHLESIGNALMARMLEIEQLLERLTQIANVVANAPRVDETIAITVDGRTVGTLSLNVGQARQLFEVLFHRSQPVGQLLNAMRASAGFLYPTEDLSYTGTLAYYRQREWRIVSAMARPSTQSSLARNLTSAPAGQRVHGSRASCGRCQVDRQDLLILAMPNRRVEPTRSASVAQSAELAAAAHANGVRHLHESTSLALTSSGLQVRRARVARAIPVGCLLQP